MIASNNASAQQLLSFLITGVLHIWMIFLNPLAIPLPILEHPFSNLSNLREILITDKNTFLFGSKYLEQSTGFLKSNWGL